MSSVSIGHDIENVKICKSFGISVGLLYVQNPRLTTKKKVLKFAKVNAYKERDGPPRKMC